MKINDDIKSPDSESSINFEQMKNYVNCINIGFKSIGDKFIDPLTNQIVNMDYQIRKIREKLSGIIKGVTKQIRKKLMVKLNKLFGTFLGTFKTLPTGITSFLQDGLLHKGFKGIMSLIFCVFEKMIGNIGSFIGNMFQNLLGRLINGPLCAAEQFVSGIFAKLDMHSALPL